MWRAVPTEGAGARLDILGAVLVAGTASGLVLLVQSPASGVLVATVGAVLLGLGVPAAAARVRRRPEGFLPHTVVREPVVVRSALAASAVRPAHRGAGRPRPARLDAAAGRSRPGAVCCDRLPGAAAPPYRCSCDSGRPDPLRGGLYAFGSLKPRSAITWRSRSG